MKLRYLFSTLTIFAASAVVSNAAIVWQVGMDDNGWPVDGVGGGPEADFIQEAGVNALPGDPASPLVAQMSDDDYYFAGEYNTVLDGGAYLPVGIVASDELGAERAYAGTDVSLRYHFNLPASITATDLLSVTFDANNLDGVNGPDVNLRRWGVEVYFNGNLVMSEVEIYDPASGQAAWTPGASVALLDDDITTPSFTLGDVNGMTGAGFDNYVELRGINHSATGGGNWMGIDYVQLDGTTIPEPSAPLLIALAAAGVAFRRRR